MKSRKVVIVDDNPDLVELVALAFEQHQVDVQLEVARNGRQAMDLLLDQRRIHEGDWPPALVLLDLDLPDIHGLEILDALRKNERTALWPVVILTTSMDEQDLVKCYRVGANSFIRKPHLSKQLFAVVQELGIYWLDINRIPLQVQAVV